MGRSVACCNDDGKMKINYEVINRFAKLYDEGDTSPINYVGKLLCMAYDDGYVDGKSAAEDTFNKMNVLLFGEAGHA